MRRKERLPELLAPAGNFECLIAAVEAGADAVYVGGVRFGARAFAKNFDTGAMIEAVKYCHLHGVKLYVTVNTLVEDRELDTLLQYVGELYSAGVDAIIVADAGVCAMIREAFPDLPLHASTQMSVHNTEGAMAAYRLGCERVVPARELPASQIQHIVDETPLEVEIFLHGALCVCYSGQCLYSSLVGGRSGNRGECAQPCRLPYNGSYPLSLMDLSLAEHIPEIISSGVSSLKIEGRMKSAGYVYAVTSVYRKLLDEGRGPTQKERELLRKAFTRGGFTDGYYTDRKTDPMTGIRSEADKEDSRPLNASPYEPRRVAVSAKAKMRVGEPSVLTLTDGKRSVTVTGACPQLAERAALTRSDIADRLSKTGNSFLSLDPDRVDLDADEGIFLPVSALNALRRDAVAAFEYCGRELPEITPPAMPKRTESPTLVTAEFYSERTYMQVLEFDADAMPDVCFVPLFSSDEAVKSAGAVSLPSVLFDREWAAALTRLAECRALGAEYAMANNIGQIAPLRELGFRVMGGFRLNLTNRRTAAVYERMGVWTTIASPEQTLPKIRDCGGGAVCYGRIPLMITERCFIRENFGCENCEKAELTDRRGEKFPIIKEYPHRNVILNSVPTYMGDRPDELRKNAIRHKHLIFTVESAEQVKEILSALRSAKPLDGIKPRRAGRRDQVQN